LGAALVVYSVNCLQHEAGKDLSLGIVQILAYLFFLGCGSVILYSVMIGLASTSIWLGRNQNLYDFWFYITNFYRYPMEIYMRSGIGMALWASFMFVIPILVVSNVPARVLAQPLGSTWTTWEWGLACFTVVATLVSFAISRWIFQRALQSYRSASS
jgi:ABC-2 type transport system permease protein